MSRIFGVFSSGFFAQNNSNVLVELFFACFCNFEFLTQNDHFAKAIAFAWAIAFARWSIFKIVSFLEYFEFFRAGFCTEHLQCSCRMVFRMLLEFFEFLTQTDHFAKALALAWAIAFARWPIFKIVSFFEYLVFFRAAFCTEQL